MDQFIGLLLSLLSFTAAICFLQFLVASPLRMARRLTAGSIHMNIQIFEQVARAHLPPRVEVINLGVWGNDPCLVAALKEQVKSVGRTKSE